MNGLREQLSDHLLNIGVMERRWHRRYEVDVAAEISFNGSSMPQPCRILNYSMGGLFVETAAPLHRHQFVSIWIPQSDGGVKIVRGMVIHLTDNGAGIEAEQRFWARDCDFCQEVNRPRLS